jgi:hypothetical protein
VISPRTWTLSEKRQPWWDGPGLRVKPGNECSFSDEVLTQVVELVPVLDLLERSNIIHIYRGSECVADCPACGVAALLREHGRLGE